MKSILGSILLGFALITSGCNDSDEAPAETPVERPQSANFVWTQVHYESLLPEPPQTCDQAEEFTVTQNGAWNWEWCNENKSGTVTDAELAELNSRVAAVQEDGFSREFCLEIFYGGRIELDVTYKPSDGRTLHTLSARGSCFIADSVLVNAVGSHVTTLRDKYTGFHTQPAAAN